MRYLSFSLSLIATLALVWALNKPWGKITFRPAYFLSPQHGFWQQAEPAQGALDFPMPKEGLKDKVEVLVDSARVVHLFAQNDEDLAFAQGYITAKDRLWQMETQVRVAEGRLSEVLGEKTLEVDKDMRRKGLAWAAERSWTEASKDAKLKAMMESYSAGINAWIAQLDEKSLPLEYKLLNYQPEAWTPLKSMLLLKYMANNLTGSSDDLAFDNARKIWGENYFRVLYPERAFPQSPIIPEETTFDFVNERRQSPHKGLQMNKKGYSKSLSSPAVGEIEDPLIGGHFKGIGSNNWAISGAKSASGAPILCNDPHLGLNLPSIWYVIQLNAPGLNAIGASLPGAPGVISGFNDSIAWGVTNASRDVMDFYSIQFKDAKKEEYKVGEQWLKAEKRIEKILVKGGETLLDTVIYTQYGPIYHDVKDGKTDIPLALRWTAHDPAGEAATFWQLNKAKNYDDYVKAISVYGCPGQNFVFASRRGDVAMWQQGSFVNKLPGEGLGVRNGADTAQTWKFIPQAHNPHVLNPARGYVQSVNQWPTAPTYPYWISGEYEYFRNRRITALLDSSKGANIADMQKIQLDAFGVYAQDILPLMLSEVSDSALSDKGKEMRKILTGWQYTYTKAETAPVIFEAWWYYLQQAIWKDEFDAQKGELSFPDQATSIVLLRDSAKFLFYDNISTNNKKETRKDLFYSSFAQAVDSVQRVNANLKEVRWADARGTMVRHLLRLAPFSHYNVQSDGNKSILNATGKTWGPSWRMVVELGKEIEAYGIYPGGQSGNPGSPFYDNFLPEWAAGKYRKLLFMQSEKDKGCIYQVSMSNK